MAPSKLDASIYPQIGSMLVEPDSQIIQETSGKGPGWYQILTPSVKDMFLNEVSVSHFGQASESEIVKKVDGIVREYKKHGVPLKWLVGPMSSPSMLEHVLRPRASMEWWFRGMALDSSVTLSVSDQITTERVCEKNFDEFLDLHLKALGREAYRQNGLRWKHLIVPEDAKYRYFMSRIQGVAIGAAGTILKQGYGYLVGAVIQEKYRGAGAYRALVAVRMRDLAALRFPFAVTMARESTSAPILEKFGAETTYRAQVFRFYPA